MKTVRLILPALLSLVVAPPGLWAAGRAVPPPACCMKMPAAAAMAPLSGSSLYQLDATWTTDGGRPFRLVELRGRPVVIAMFYTSCGYACPLIVSQMAGIEHGLPAAVRRRARFVLVSFDHERDTVAALHAYREQHGLDGSWVLLRGSPGSIRELAAALGVTYDRTTNGMFNHSSAITVLDSGGEMIHQRAGLEGGLDAVTRTVVAAR